MLSNLSRLFSLIAPAAILLTLLACVDFESSSVKPTAMAPESTSVDAVTVSYDKTVPTYVLAVEPVHLHGAVTEKYTLIQGVTAEQRAEQSKAVGTGRENAKNSSYSQSTSRSATDKEGAAQSSLSIYEAARTSIPDVQALKIAAQLTSALSGVENFSLRDLPALRRTKEGQFTTSMQAGQVGPFIVRALLTEYNPEATLDKSKISILPGTSFEKDRRVGVVTLDVSIVDGRNGAIVASFPATGTFAWRKKESDVGILFSGYSAEKQARSVMDNAMRAAMNDASVRSYRKLSESVR